MVSATPLMPPVPGAAPRGSETGAAGRRDPGFAQHQAWLKACEQAAWEARTPAQGDPGAGPAAANQTADAADAGQASAQAAPALDGLGGRQGAARVPDAEASMAGQGGLPGVLPRPSPAALPDPAASGLPGRLPHLAPRPAGFAVAARSAMPAASHGATEPVAGEPQTSAAAMPATPSSVFEQVQRMRVFAPLPEACVTVYQDASRLALTVRDARLAGGEGEAILQRLRAAGLPPGLQHLSVTVNGRRHRSDLSSEGH